MRTQTLPTAGPAAARDLHIELAGPLDFLPKPDGWRRGSPQDLDDVRAMLDRGLTDAHAIRCTFEGIRPALYRFPAVDGDRLAAQVTAALLGRA